MSGLIGRKLGMTSIFDSSGNNVGCTVIEAGPCYVTQIKNLEKDGYKSIQLAFDELRSNKLRKSVKGHFNTLKIAPKKKSFLARKATITKKRDEPEDSDSVTIQDTPKFRLLELVRSLDTGEGIDPDTLVTKAEEEGIARPRLQMNKMIRRGILYVHLDRVHIT